MSSNLSRGTTQGPVKGYFKLLICTDLFAIVSWVFYERRIIMKATVMYAGEEFTLDSEKVSSDAVVYDTLEDAMRAQGTGYGCELNLLTPEELDKIKNGGVFAFCDGEYVHYIALRDAP